MSALNKLAEDLAEEVKWSLEEDLGWFDAEVPLSRARVDGLIDFYAIAAAMLKKGYRPPLTPDLSIAEIRHLREQSGAPVMECRDALLAEAGDQYRAHERLRMTGAAS